MKRKHGDLHQAFDLHEYTAGELGQYRHSTFDNAVAIMRCDPFTKLVYAKIRNCLDVQITHVERVVFDKLAAAFDVLAHQCGEDHIALHNVFQ